MVIGGNMPVWENDVKRTLALGRVIKGNPLVYKSVSTDAVLGGCILSAGELDSSKEYLQQGDGSWVLVYQVIPLHFPCLLQLTSHLSNHSLLDVLVNPVHLSATFNCLLIHSPLHLH